MSEFGQGLFIGKFYPPHRGHHTVIDAAAARCDRLSVLVMAAAPETVPLADRVAWLRETHSDQSNVTVAGIPCDAPLDVTDQRVWAAQVAAMRAGLRAAGCPPEVDVVFCGDDYGDELARWFDATCVRITRSPVSASAVRRDLAGRWLDLAEATRAGLTTRVVVLGAESTGTTTIAARLQQHYSARGGVWARTHNVEEYGREHTAVVWERQSDRAITELSWSHADFDAIGIEQNRREEAAARAGSPILLCDTDAFATSVWERRYLGTAARSGQPWRQGPRRAMYLLTDHADVPWHDDGMREGDLEIRAAMTGWFADALTSAGHSWVLLTGSLSDRVELAVRTVDPLLRLAMSFGEPLHGPGFE